MMVLDLAGALQGVVDALTNDAGVEIASTDPAAIIGPGVLVQLVEFEPLVLDGGWELSLNLILVVQDSDGGPGPARALGDLLNLILGWATPDGPIQARSIQLPSTPAPLPGLVFPLTVRTDA